MEYYTPEKNVEISYQISGNESGPKMVLIHGLFLNSDCWKFQLPIFESKFHVLRFDLRGHGRSTKPKKRFTIRNYVDDMFGLLNHINWTNELYLVGHSLGGMIALVYGLENPSHVRKMVVADSFCFISQEAITDVLGRVNNSKLEQFALGISVRGMVPYNDEKAEFVAKLVTDHMTKKDCLQATAASAGFNICENLKSLNLPALILVGKKDITTPVWASEMIHEWLPRSELIIIPDAGHLIILDHPDEFNNLVLSFWN
ncbi:MAG: alpha/beta hydrolase [Candidatus Lokiarchaeota archaeon]|nr:alpha/beta hydrolase [Candidatus Lokiarchaeota archaeon]